MYDSSLSPNAPFVLIHGCADDRPLLLFSSLWIIPGAFPDYCALHTLASRRPPFRDLPQTRRSSFVGHTSGERERETSQEGEEKGLSSSLGFGEGYTYRVRHNCMNGTCWRKMAFLPFSKGRGLLENSFPLPSTLL